MNTSCLLSLLLTNQTLSPFVVCLPFLVIIKNPRFFFLPFFSGQGCAGNYKSIEAWPGLYNLCGIFVQCRFCVRAASENGLGSAFWSGIGVFSSALFPANHFYEELGWKRMFHTHVSTWELNQSRSSTLPLDFPKIFDSVSTLSCCMFWLFELLYECWTTSSAGSCTLVFIAHTSTNLLCCFFPSTHSALLYSCTAVVNKACPLASSFLWSSSSLLGKELWKSYVGQVQLLVPHHSCICIKSTRAF